jgi:hypothetical protein
MADPLKLAGALAEFGFVRYAKLESKRGGATLLLKVTSVVCSTVCAGLAGGFAVAALLIYLIPLVGAAEASLIVGGVLLICAVAAGIAPSIARLRHKLPEAIPSLDAQALLAHAEGFVRQNKGLVLSVAFVAGLLIAEKTRVANR